MSCIKCIYVILILIFDIIGVLAMEALHRQVLPFVLRRMKEDVLSDLPPKITQVNYRFIFIFTKIMLITLNL